MPAECELQGLGHRSGGRVVAIASIAMSRRPTAIVNVAGTDSSFETSIGWLTYGKPSAPLRRWAPRLDDEKLTASGDLASSLMVSTRLP